MGVTRGNIQQISYIPQTAQHSPFRLLHLGNVTIIYVLSRLCVKYVTLHSCGQLN